MSEPVKTAMGWHLVLVEEADAGAIPPFDLLDERVVDAMKADALDRLRAGLRERQPVSVDRAALATLLK